MKLWQCRLKFINIKSGNHKKILQDSVKSGNKIKNQWG